MNGRRTVYIPVTKRADASTLSVVSLVKENLPKFQSVLPAGVKVSYEFDQSPYVTRAIGGLGEEGLLGAVLTGLMVLLFLRDWRSALVVVLNIPLSLAAALLALWSHRADDQHHDARRAGAGGRHPGGRGHRLHRKHPHASGRGQSLKRAALDATTETTLPRLLAMLCILAVFIPAFFMQGAARSLFVPLALAVGFSMVASYLLSSTLVPILSVWLLRSASTAPAMSSRRTPVRPLPRRLRPVLGERRRGCAGWWCRCICWPPALVIFFVGRSLGREIFPIVDAGQFQLRLRAPAGTRIEQTEAVAKKTLDVIGREAGPDNVADHPRLRRRAGRGVSRSTPSTSGPAARKKRCSRSSSSRATVRIEELKERLRRNCPRNCRTCGSASSPATSSAG